MVSFTADAAPVDRPGTVPISKSVAGPWIRAIPAAMMAIVGTMVSQ